ncbi:MAG TPA: undecaprenyl-phosphate alpha-N-acetylglucosaminyl 1-phosphate transferase [Clostridiales bacterium]|jgi:UDP-GlcNAc:undecaprenyl-phosphate GlcNAc-1-phosphate transferase|nr:undecaprenyl-phosphate alpha-N-acetylglucosaminyl 1-phosphate transferase [Clostridiales bacterium]
MEGNMLTRQVLFMIFAFIVSFAFTFATTPLVRRFAFKIGAIDIPKDNRRMHKKPTPRIGGLAIIFGFTVATLCFAQPSRQLYGTLAGAAIIAVMGVIDDCKNLPAKLKFVIQIIAALVVVFAGDIKIDVFTNPNFLSDNPYWVLPEWLSVTLTVIWIVFITNAVNFIDGLDGLAAGVSAIMSISLVFISIRVGEYSIAILGIALMGSCFGFLPFNFNPAKIFMGDTGSTFLGFMLATLSIQGVFKSYAVISFAVPLLILGLPLFDALFAMIRRILRGQSPMTADRGHLHHRLVDMGFSQKQTVFILYAISGVLGITAVLLAESGVLRALLLVICVLILLLIGSMLGKNSYVHQHQDNRNLTDDNEIDVEEVSDKKGNEDK